MTANKGRAVVPMQITKDWAIMEVLQAYPRTRAIFQRYGMGCLECMGAARETIAGGARSHGVNVEELLQDLNAAIRSQD